MGCFTLGCFFGCFFVFLAEPELETVDENHQKITKKTPKNHNMNPPNI